MSLYLGNMVLPRDRYLNITFKKKRPFLAVQVYHTGLNELQMLWLESSKLTELN